MTKPSTPLAIRALACHGATETPYTRAGDGASLVLVADDAEVRKALVATLSLRYRVLAPDTPDPFETIGGAFSTWLRGFLDALGVHRLTLVADEQFGAAAMAFAALHPDLIESMVITFRGSAAERAVWYVSGPWSSLPHRPSSTDSIDLSKAPSGPPFNSRVSSDESASSQMPVDYSPAPGC